KLLILKDGYTPKTVAVDSDIADTRYGLTIILRKGHKHSNKALGGLWMTLKYIAGRFFEISLFGSVILEIGFFSIFGFLRTLPFFLLSFFNLVLWIFYQREKQTRKVLKKE